MVFKLFHTENIADIEYKNENYNKVNSSDIDYKHPFLLFTKLNNGKYNLNTIDYLLSENPNINITQENANLPKNLDELSKSYFNSYLIKKEGLVTYYPITKEIKYKSIEKFQGNFARFELPNGQKGWLCKDGKEYLDE